MRALVVDDSRPVRSIIAKMMQSLHFETREVTNGQEAWKLLESDDAYDVVTVNWQMPIMDGMEFVAAVRSDRRFRHLPLLMISSESDADQVAMAMQAGVTQYIVKPCTARSIAAKLTLMGLIKDASASSNSIACPAASSVSPAVLTNRSDSASSKIRVLLVDDSSVVRRVLTQNLSAASDMEVVGGACDGIEGLEMIERLSPDVVLLDVDMPRMDGLETLRQLRARNIHASVLMFSSRTERGAKTATDALLLGAKDFVFKPGVPTWRDLTAGAKTILDEVIPRLRSLARRGPSLAVGSLRTDARPLTTRVDLVVIGASTGGPAALAELVSSGAFRENLTAPIVIAQHMPEIFTKHLASRLSLDSGLNVAEASDGESLKRGMIRIVAGRSARFDHPLRYGFCHGG